MTPLSSPLLCNVFHPQLSKSKQNSDYPCWRFSPGNTAVWATRSAKQRLFSHPRRLTGRWERDCNNSSSHSSSAGFFFFSLLPGDLQRSGTRTEGVDFWELKSQEDFCVCFAEKEKCPNTGLINGNTVLFCVEGTVVRVFIPRFYWKMAELWQIKRLLSSIFLFCGVFSHIDSSFEISFCGRKASGWKLSLSILNVWAHFMLFCQIQLSGKLSSLKIYLFDPRVTF